MSDVRDDAHGTSVARQLSLPLGQAQRKRAQQMCATTRAMPQATMTKAFGQKFHES